MPSFLYKTQMGIEVTKMSASYALKANLIGDKVGESLCEILLVLVIQKEALRQ